jgi:hypothetical protein
LSPEIEDKKVLQPASTVRNQLSNQEQKRR